MDAAKTFVNNEYTIRSVFYDDIRKWETDSNYDKEAYEFTETVIKKLRSVIQCRYKFLDSVMWCDYAYNYNLLFVEQIRIRRYGN